MSEWLKDLLAEIGANTFRQVLGGVALAAAILAIAGVRHLWPNCPPAGYAVLTLLAVSVVVAVAALSLRATVGNTHLLFDVRQRETRLAFGGLAAALLLAMGLFAYEWHDQRVAAAMQAQSQADEDSYHEQLRAMKGITLPPRP